MLRRSVVFPAPLAPSSATRRPVPTVKETPRTAWIASPYETSRFDYDEACRATLRLLDRDPRPTAIFCDDDILAGGVYLGARERGLRIPDDLSIAGFDDLPFARVFDPALTTIRIDPEALGATAFELLADLMAGREPGGHVLPVELVVRGSTGPAPD